MTLLLIDGNNQAFVSNCSKSLSSKSGFPTQAIYGFLEAIRHYIKEFDPDKIITVFDGGHSQKRKEIYPQYKNRDKKEDEKLKEFYQQLPKIKEMLICLGIDTFERDATEADDIISFLAQTTKAQDVIIVSSDKDFYQIINEDISIYSPMNSSKVRYLNSSNFKRAKGLRTSQWLDYRSMMGDSGDNIPGVSGVGKKTALLILQKFGSYRSFRKAVIDGRYSISNLEKKAFDGIESFELSKRLMDLKSNDMFDSSNIYESIKHGEKDKGKLVEMFKELDMKDALHNVNEILDNI